jgi:hypothetical protein
MPKARPKTPKTRTPEEWADELVDLVSGATQIDHEQRSRYRITDYRSRTPTVVCDLAEYVEVLRLNAVSILTRALKAEREAAQP